MKKEWIKKVRNPAFIKQHSVDGFKKAMKNLYEYSSIKHGNIKKGEGDIVIINLKNTKDNEVDFKEYITYCRDIKEIKTVGIFTNIYFSSSFFEILIDSIVETK